MLSPRGASRLRRVALLTAIAAVTALPSLASPASAISATVHGPDVSRYQHPQGQAIDWTRVKASGAAFTFIKASQSTTKVDPWFAREWAASGKTGIVRGAYHYADPSTSADTQAAHVVSVVGSTRAAGQLPIVLDLESTGGLSPGALAAWAHAFLSGVESRTGRVPILYTYPYFWHTAMANNTTFGAYPLWLATFSSKAPAVLPGWKAWTWWQHSDNSSVPGIPGGVDESYLCCHTGVLAALSDGRSGPITTLWKKLGGASGVLGLPTGAEVAITGGWAQTYQHGYVATASGAGTHSVQGVVWERYLKAGGAKGALGPPTGEQYALKNGGIGQDFAHGSIFWSRLTGAHAVRGGYLARWKRDGAASSTEGLPTSEQVGAAQQFASGGLYGTSSGVHLVPGAIRDRYEQLGGATSKLGLPRGEASTLLGTTTVPFQVGSLTEVEVAGKALVA